MYIKGKLLVLWLWLRLPVVQGRLFLLVSSLAIFTLVADSGYVTLPSQQTVCIFNANNFICRLLFFSTFVTMVTCLVFLGLDPYLPDIQVLNYLRMICLIDFVTAVLLLFIWTLGSFLMLIEWFRSETPSSDINSSCAIIVLSLCGAGCWVLLVILLTRKLQEVNTYVVRRNTELHTSHPSPSPSDQTENQLSATSSIKPVTKSV